MTYGPHAPRTYRDLADKFFAAAMKGEGDQRFNYEQALAWDAYAERLHKRNIYLATAHRRKVSCMEAMFLAACEIDAGWRWAGEQG